MKVCNRKDNCVHGNKMQPLSNFHRRPGSSDGRVGICKDCRKEKWISNQPKAKDLWLNMIIGTK
jgi:hypothetical protein